MICGRERREHGEWSNEFKERSLERSSAAKLDELVGMSRIRSSNTLERESAQVCRKFGNHLKFQIEQKRIFAASLRLQKVM